MYYTNIDKVLTKHSGLSVVEYDSNHAPQRIIGDFIMNSSYENVCFCKTYPIDVDLSDFPPKVKEVGNKIRSSYPHRYDSGELCLEVPSRMKLICIEGDKFDFEKWVNCFLVPYFFSYEFFKRYGRYPFGERSHGQSGILEYYTELFHLSSKQQTKGFLEQVIRMRSYRGHHLCPCGSGLKIRDCHKKEVEMALQPLYKECIKEDLSKREGR